MDNPETELDGFIYDKKMILKEIEAAKENKSLLGIWSVRLGDQMLMCEVESIHLDRLRNDTAIIFREKNLNGESLQTQYLFIQEIDRVHRFKKI